MNKLNKPCELTITLIIIYFALVAVSIALYALIQIFFKSDTATASSLLGWTATIFATIALLYTFNSWRDQKGSEVIANEAKFIINDLNVIHETAYKLQDLFLANKIEELKDQIKLFNQQRNNIDSKMNLFNTLVEVGLKKDIQLEIFKHNHLQCSVFLSGNINKIIESDDNFRYKNQGLIVNQRGKYQDINIEMKNYISKYALYKILS